MAFTSTNGLDLADSGELRRWTFCAYRTASRTRAAGRCGAQSWRARDSASGNTEGRRRRNPAPHPHGVMVAAHRLGHANANVTTRHYARAIDGRDAEVARHLDRLGKPDAKRSGTGRARRARKQASDR